MIYIYRSLIQTTRLHGLSNISRANYLLKSSFSTAARQPSSGGLLFKSNAFKINLSTAIRRIGFKSKGGTSGTAKEGAKKIPKSSELKRLLSLAKPHRLKISRM